MEPTGSSCVEICVQGCSFIKIEVEFRAKSGHQSMDSSPSDRVVHISKPYLEYPILD